MGIERKPMWLTVSSVHSVAAATGMSELADPLAQATIIETRQVAVHDLVIGGVLRPFRPRASSRGASVIRSANRQLFRHTRWLRGASVPPAWIRKWASHALARFVKWLDCTHE